MDRIAASTAIMRQMLEDQNNPKTLYYYTSRLLGVHLKNSSHILYNGQLNLSLAATHDDMLRALDLLPSSHQRTANLKRGQIFFVLDLFKHQSIPKSRSLRMCGRNTRTVLIPHPDRGKSQFIAYRNGGGYTVKSPDFDNISRTLTMYCRNAWERKGELNITAPAAAEETVHNGV